MIGFEEFIMLVLVIMFTVGILIPLAKFLYEYIQGRWG